MVCLVQVYDELLCIASLQTTQILPLKWPAMTKTLTAVVNLYYPSPSPCSVVLFSDDFCSTLTKFCSPGCPQAFSLLELCCLRIWGFAALLSRVFCIAPRDTCLDYVHHGIACLASQASNWAGALWDSLSDLWLATHCQVFIQA